MSKIDCLFIHVPQIGSLHNREYNMFINNIAMGIFSICNELYKKGFNPKIIHLGIEKALDFNFNIAKYIKKHRIKLVGLSMHWHYQTYDTLHVARYIKEQCPETYIFLGGLTASAFAKDILKKHSYIDAVIKGEGEKPIVKLTQQVKSKFYDLSKIENLYYRNNNKICYNKKLWYANKDELNNYNFNGLKFLENHDTYLKFPIFFTKYINQSTDKINLLKESLFVCCLGRGCLGNCTWCGGGFNALKKITGRDKVTLRDANIVANELIELKNNYNIDEFYMCFDPYPNNQQNIIDLIKILGQKFPRKFKISYECFGLPTIEFIDMFKKYLNIDSKIIISPEFANQELRNKHKSFNFSNESLIECVTYIAKKQIPCELFFADVFFETPKQKQETIDLCSYLSNLYQEKSLFYQLKCRVQKIDDYEPFSPWVVNPEFYNATPKTKTLDDYIQLSKGFRDLI